MNEPNLSHEAWNGIQTIAARFNLSVAELLERLGRGMLTVVDPEDLEDYMDVQESLIAESLPENQERIPWEQVKEELEL